MRNRKQPPDIWSRILQSDRTAYVFYWIGILAFLGLLIDIALNR